MRTLLVALAIALVAPLVAAAPVQPYTWMPAQGEPAPEFGPDVPDALPVATVTAFVDEKWHSAGDVRYHAIDVPNVHFSRVVMTYRQNPEGDPWDRLFQAFIGPVEVLRGAAPRSDMTVTKDLTRYASMLVPGSTAQIGASTSEWDEAQYAPGYQHVWVTLDFYDDATSALVEGAATAVVPVYANAGSCGAGGVSPPIVVPNVTFHGAPNVTVEFFATNHASEEGYKLSKSFDVIVDGQLVTTVIASQYRYAWIGQYGGDETLHPVMWWSAFQALEIAGVHTGVGEIPPYRLALNATQLAPLTAGTHTVTLQPHGIYSCVWITSLSFLEEP